MNIEKIELAISQIKQLEEQREKIVEEQKKLAEQLDNLVKEIEKSKKLIFSEMKGLLPDMHAMSGKMSTGTKRTSGGIFDVILTNVFKDGDEIEIKDIVSVVVSAGYKESSIPVALNKLVKSGKLARVKRGVYRINKQA